MLFCWSNDVVFWYKKTQSGWLCLGQFQNRPWMFWRFLVIKDWIWHPFIHYVLLTKLHGRSLGIKNLVTGGMLMRAGYKPSTDRSTCHSSCIRLFIIITLPGVYARRCDTKSYLLPIKGYITISALCAVLLIKLLHAVYMVLWNKNTGRLRFGQF